MLEDKWASRDLSVLLEVARQFDGGRMSHLAVEEVAETLSMGVDDVRRAAQALKIRGLVEAWGPAEISVTHFHGITADAYLMTGLHPNGDDAISDLIEALRQAADRVDDLDERSRLRKLADGVSGVSRDGFASVLAAVNAKQAGA